jgi:signal transduction histidine kinase
MEPNRSVLEFSALSTVLLAHDLQHLLTIMSACADSLARRSGSGMVDRDVAELNDAIDSAFRLSHELLVAAGLHEAVEPPVIDVHELLMRYQGAMRRLVGKEVRLVITMGPTPALIAATPVQVEWILLHLLANARDLMPAGGVVYLDTARIERWSGPPEAPSRDERYLQITIRNEGSSDEPENAAVFDPFFTIRKGAIGLGLTSVSGTVRAQKGWLYIEGHEPAGRTVHVLLPLYAATRGEDERDQRSPVG